MSSTNRSDAPERTGHVAPDETLDPSRYTAHIEGTTRVVEQAHEPFETVEEAIAWATQRAPTVLVRVLGDDTLHWAGRRPLASAPDMPRWHRTW